MPLLPPRTGDLSRYSPKVHYGETQLPLILERFALRAEQKRKARREAEVFRKLGIELPGAPKARPEPTSMLGGVMRGIKDVFTPAPAPRTDLETAVIEAQIEQKYPSQADLLTTMLLSDVMGKRGAGMGETPEKPPEEPPEGYEWSLKEDTYKGVPRRRWVPEKIPEPKKSEKELFREDLAETQANRMTWGGLKVKWPDKRKEIRAYEEQAARLTKKPIKPVKTFMGIRPFRARLPEHAAMNEATKAIVGKVKTKADLRKLIERAGPLRDSGVDVDALLRYYAEEIKALEF